MRILFALSGLHRYDRGAETAFIAVASELAKMGDTVTLIGSGRETAGAPYRFLHAPSLAREKFEAFPFFPALRDECAYEDLTFAPQLWKAYHPRDYDVTLTCSYPFTNWVLRRPILNDIRPPTIFVTQNGDWPALASNSEYRFFGCEGLICTNPEFYNRNKTKWRCELIPNGVDLGRFGVGVPKRAEFGLPPDRLIVLMVSALIPTKCVSAGIEAVSRIPNAHLVVAGDGPLREDIDACAANLLPGRFTRLTLTPEKIPELYRSADVFLHLSKIESFGNVFVEAMACGLPIVGHDSSRLRWIVGDDEFLLDTSDIVAVASSIRLASRLTQEDRNKRSIKASSYSWSRIARSYREFFQEVISSQRSTSHDSVGVTPNP
jgi:glycosyltransferase involved in cell wall biosynthesis